MEGNKSTKRSKSSVSRHVNGNAEWRESVENQLRQLQKMTEELLFCLQPEEEDSMGRSEGKLFLQSRIEVLDATLKNSEMIHNKEVKQLMDTTALMKESSSRYEAELVELRQELATCKEQNAALKEKIDVIDFSIKVVVKELASVMESSLGILQVPRQEASSASIEAMIVSLDASQTSIERLVRSPCLFQHKIWCEDSLFSLFSICLSIYQFISFFLSLSLPL